MRVTSDHERANGQSQGRPRRWTGRRDPLDNPEPLIRRVYAYTAYRVGPGADAEDITSEVFERALRYEDSYDESKGEFVGWLLGIARRCVDQHPSQPQHISARAEPAGVHRTTSRPRSSSASRSERRCPSSATGIASSSRSTTPA